MLAPGGRIILQDNTYRSRWGTDPADRGDAAAQPGHSVWRSALAVGRFSTGNALAKVGEPAWRRCDLSARTKLPGVRNAEFSNARRATIKGDA
jgi:hypothetical protein